MWPSRRKRFSHSHRRGIITKPKDSQRRPVAELYVPIKYSEHKKPEELATLEIEPNEYLVRLALNPIIVGDPTEGGRPALTIF